MPNIWLDSYELIVAVYLFYVAAKGEGQLYRFGNLSEERRESIRRPLRIFYAACGAVALLGFGVSVLQNTMFAVNPGTGEITQNFAISAMPGLSYELLGRIGGIFSAVFILLLMCLIAALMKLSKKP